MAFWGSRGKLDADSLVRLATEYDDARAASPEMLEQVQALLTSLREMHEGRFLRPMHHTHDVETPFHASYSHFTSGANYGLYAVFAWLLIWPAYLVLFRRASVWRGLTPGRAFLQTGGVVIAIDVTLIGIHRVFSTGNTSQVIEFLLGVLNMPAAIVLAVLDHPFAFSGTVLAIGAVGWSVIASVAVLLKRRTRRRAPVDDASAGDPDVP